VHGQLPENRMLKSRKLKEKLIEEGA
jgi:hypothetical protein